MNGTMLAAVYGGKGELRLERRPCPSLLEPRDAIVRVTCSTICTSDLHILNGAVPQAVPGTILGHEFVGEIAEIGSGIHNLSIGQRVSANCETFCGQCWFCNRGFVNNCETGGWKLGCTIDGCQAEYVRVPFADICLTPIPDSLSDEDALFVGDILSSGYFAAELCSIQPGDTVVILGAGPVGLCAGQCARLFGAGKIIYLEPQEKRLQLALSNHIGDAGFNPLTCHPLSEIRSLTGGRGADCVIEAAGASTTFQTAWEIARPNGIVALVAMYEQDQILPLPRMYGKNLTFKTGGVDACHCSVLMELLAQKKLDTSFLITHRGTLEHIVEGYRVFSSQKGDCLKWVIIPPEKSSSISGRDHF